jgi:hypothetical protein
MALSQESTRTPVEQNEEPRNKSMNIWEIGIFSRWIFKLMRKE